MNDLLKMHFKLFIREKSFFGLYITNFIFCFFGMLFYILKKVDPIFLFYLVARFIIYVSILFCVMVFLYLRSAKKNKLEETLLAVDNTENKYLQYSTIVVLLLFGLLNIVIISMLFINAFINNQLNTIIDLFLSSYFLNIFMPQLVMICLTIAISSLENKYYSMILFVLSVLLFSPLTENLVWIEKPLIPIDQIINYISLPFAVFYQNSNWAVDYLYGLQNELYKICADIFWILLSLGIVKRKNIYKSKPRLLISSLAVVLLFSSIYIPQSLGRTNEKWNQGRSDINYYGVFQSVFYNIKNTGCDYKIEKEISYYIDKYDLDVNINHKLNVDANMKLISKQPQKEFDFTLYRNYKIRSLNSNDLKSYAQNGDFIHIEFNKPIKNTNIEIKYSGYHPNLYSNNQAVVLPGYFAWYPMAGEKQLYCMFEKSSNTRYGYNPYIRNRKCIYNVSIKSNYSILCNLVNKNKNIFSGKSDSLTIIGGNQVIKKDNMFENYYPLFLTNEMNYEKFSNTRNNYLNKFEKRIHNTFHIKPTFENKKIITIANTIRNCELGNYAEFDDYLIMSNAGFVDNQQILKYYIYHSDIDMFYKDILANIPLTENSQDYIDAIYHEIDNQLDCLDNETDKDMINKYQSLKNRIKENIENKGLDNYLKELGYRIFN